MVDGLVGPDFTTEYFHIPITFSPLTAGESAIVEPGESCSFVASAFSLGNSVNFDMSTAGEYFARVWINPDLSVRFANPEDELIESHETVELDYSKNLSPLASFENVRDFSEDSCELDGYEQNDSFTSATVIALDTRYDMNGCDDLSEVVVVDLVAGQDYEIQDHYNPRESTDQPPPTPWDLTIVDPNTTSTSSGGRNQASSSRRWCPGHTISLRIILTPV